MYSIPETEARRYQERIHRRESRQTEINSFQSFFRWQIPWVYLQPGVINAEQNRRSQACHQLSIDSERRIINHPLIITFVAPDDAGNIFRFMPFFLRGSNQCGTVVVILLAVIQPLGQESRSFLG